MNFYTLNEFPLFLQFFASLSFSLLFGLIFIWAIQAILGRSFLKETSKKAQKHLWLPLYLLAPLMIWPFMIKILEVADIQQYISFTFFTNLYIILIAWALISLSTIAKEWILKKYDIHKSDNRKERKIYTQLLFLKRLFMVIIIIIAIGSMLMTYEPVRKIGAAVLSSAGVLGIIIGFAAQRSIANLLAGLQIAFNQPIKIDDAVVVEGEWGKIEEINLTYVVVKIWDQRRLVLPINYFIERPFQNWTRETADIWGTAFFYVDYTVDVAALRAYLTTILENSPYWDGKLNVLQVTDTTDKTIEIRCLMSAVDSPTAFDLRCEVREKMIAYIQSNYPNCLPKIRFEKENG